MRYSMPPSIAALLSRLTKPEAGKPDVKPARRRTVPDRRVQLGNPALRRSPAQSGDRASNM